MAIILDEDAGELVDEAGDPLLDESVPHAAHAPLVTYPLIRLEAAGRDPLMIDDDHGFFGQRLDLGDAVTRDVVDDAPDADGTDDTTQLFGARNITLQVILYPETSSLWELRQRLRSFTHPRIRPYMYLQVAAAAPEQRITLRRGQFTDVIGDGIRPSTQADHEAATITVQWVAPLGILESSELRTARGFASGTVIDGRTYPLTFPRTYPPADPHGTITATNAGTADVYPLVRLFGPCTDPVLDNLTQDKALGFSGLTLLAGEYLEIDTRAKTILFNGDPADSRYDTLDFPTSDWWTLSPGENVLLFHPATFTTAVSLAELIWRDAYL